MPDDLLGDPPYYSAEATSTRSRYHVDENCSRLGNGSIKHERSASYVEWHDLDPCLDCVEGAEWEFERSGAAKTDVDPWEVGGDD